MGRPSKQQLDDAIIHDPLAFAPAAVRPRHDGWTAERQRAFISLR